MVNYEKKSNDFLSKPTEYPDQEKIAKAKTWYLSFTGKKYEDENIKDLVEMYNILKNLS